MNAFYSNSPLGYLNTQLGAVIRAIVYENIITRLYLIQFELLYFRWGAITICMCGYYEPI